jgi:hypothetical protein
MYAYHSENHGFLLKDYTNGDFNEVSDKWMVCLFFCVPACLPLCLSVNVVNQNVSSVFHFHSPFLTMNTSYMTTLMLWMHFLSTVK